MAMQTFFVFLLWYQRSVNSGEWPGANRPQALLAKMAPPTKGISESSDGSKPWMLDPPGYLPKTHGANGSEGHCLEFSDNDWRQNMSIYEDCFVSMLEL
ncbi:hypothetical protein JTB14_007734 [Gonioctena quinquepunctata]|nr:hypothetical protein JTB14_007734 [Gonioctena quinquepunctata]